MSFINPFQLNKTPFQSKQSSSSSSSSSAMPLCSPLTSTMPQCCPPNEQKEKSKLNRARPSPLPELPNQISKQELAQSDYSNILEGINTNIKLILKLLQEHKDSSKPDDGAKAHHLAKILTILDDNRSRMELICSHHSGRWLHSDGLSPRSPKLRSSASAEENQKLRRELSASLTARKSLEKMFSSLGREKEMIATELARRVQELSCLEELVNDLRADNSKLTEKLKAWREVGSGGMEMEEMKENNRELSEKLLKALDGYKMAKRRLREAKEENERVREEVEVVVERMRRVRERRGKGVEEEEMGELEKVLEKLAKAGLPPCSN